jgi:hypothetical protein
MSLLIFLFLIFVAGFIFVAIKGKSLLKKELAGVLKAEVKFSSVRLRPILNLEINDLEIADFAKIKHLSISPVIAGFAKGKIILGRISLFNPRISTVKAADGSWNIPSGIMEKLASKDKAGPEFLLSGLFISDGNVGFRDATKNPVFGFAVNKINVDIGNRILSFNPILTRFKAAAEVLTRKDEAPAEISANGWINFLTKDMKGMVELSGIDAAYFLPLYGKYMTTGLKKGLVDFQSDLGAKSNDLMAKCHLTVRDLVFEQNSDGTAPAISFFDVVAGGLQTENKEVNMDFMVRTKLDHPRVDLVHLSGSIVAKALGEQMIKSPQQTVENIKSVGKQFEKLGKDILKNQLGIEIPSKKNTEADNSQQQNAVAP